MQYLLKEKEKKKLLLLDPLPLFQQQKKKSPPTRFTREVKQTFQTKDETRKIETPSRFFKNAIVFQPKRHRV